MIIDTNKVLAWAKVHFRLCVSIATGLLSWIAATKWQQHIAHNEIELGIYYFFVSAASGLTTILLVIHYLVRMGLFES